MNDIDTMFSELIATLDHHRTRLAAGESVTLGGMERQVQALCQALEALPGTEGVAYREHLTLLFNELDDLGERLKASRREVQAQIEALNLNRKAQAAYKASDAVDGTALPPAAPKPEEK